MVRGAMPVAKGVLFSVRQLKLTAMVAMELPHTSYHIYFFGAANIDFSLKLMAMPFCRLSFFAII